MLDFSYIPVPFATGIFGILGLLIGSFLNVVIHRLPKMMEREWTYECHGLLNTPIADAQPYNLVVPRSACPHCNHQIRWFENIPVLSYMALRGRCAGCGAHISARYPLVEAATGALFAWCGYQFGATAATVAWCAFAALLLTMTFIDWDTQLLPDTLTYSLLWLGLVAAIAGWTAIPLRDAVIGALAGYLFLWIITQGFYLLTGKVGMGNGDFKLFAALGAWFGWQALIPLILLASLVGAIVGIAMKLRGDSARGEPIPFGPFLAGAGFLAMLLGVAPLLRAIGLAGV